MSFKLTSEFKPTGDQPEAIKSIINSFNNNHNHVTLQGVTGSGKTFTVANVIQEISKNSRKEFRDKSSKDILKLLSEKSNQKIYPSRMLNLGIYLLISDSQDFQEKNETEKNKIISDIFEKLNLSIDKAEKDIGIYKSSITKMEQAKELIQELKIKDKN